MRFSKTTEDLIADFRGLPRTTSTASKREPAPLESLLVMLQEQYKLERPGPERTLVEHWAEVFGPSLAGRCNPVRIKPGGILVVSVTNPTLRTELQFQKRTILRRIRKLDHCSDMTDIVTRG